MHNLRQHAGAKVGGCLHAHGRPEYQASNGYGPQQLVQIGFRRIHHFGFRFSAKVLHDDFLYVTVLLMNLANGQQALDAFQSGLADTDQNACRKRHLGNTSVGQRLQSDCGNFVWRAIVGHAFFAKALGRRLQHDAHGGRHRFEARQFFWF